MELVIGLISAIVIAILILTGLRPSGLQRPGPSGGQGSATGSGETGGQTASGEATRPCPVCGSRLRKGQLVKTQVFSGGDAPTREGEVKEAMAHMFGCRYCYPSGVARHCPVCRQELGPEDYIIARMFLRVDRKHMHVLGCTRCRTGRGQTGRGKNAAI